MGRRADRVYGPAAADVAVALALLAGGQVALAHLARRAGHPVAVLSVALVTGAVAVRRRAPAAAFTVAITAAAAYQGLSRDPQGAFVTASVVLVAYWLGRALWAARSYRPGGVLIGYSWVALEVGTARFGESSAAGVTGAWLAMVVVPVAVGAIVQNRDGLVRRLAAAAESIRGEQRLRAERAAAEERNRVARDLHDIVAHHVSVMVIQAGAARAVADQADTAAQALGSVAGSGREALAELRRITGVLRRDDGRWTGEPPRLDHLDALVERIQGAGVATRLELHGDPGAVPEAISLAAFRIVQEALTNVVRHAATTTADVHIAIGERSLRLQISNDGEARSGPFPVSGVGLVGMRERVALYGGELHAGPRPGGGYQVDATLPLGPAPVLNEPAPPTRPATPPQSGRRRRAIARRYAGVAFAGACLIALETEALTSSHRHGPLSLNVAVVGAMAVLGLWRRRQPLLFLAAVSALSLLLGGGLTTVRTATLTGTYLLAVPLYTVAAWEARSRAVAGLAIWETGMVTANLVAFHAPTAGIAGAGVMGVIVWAVGRVARSYRRLQEELAGTLERLAAEQGEQQRLAVAGERARIARDLEGLVARDLNAMVVQAQSVLPVVGCADPDTIRTAAAGIEATGRQALGRMREILGVLRVRDAVIELVDRDGSQRVPA